MELASVSLCFWVGLRGFGGHISVLSRLPVNHLLSVQTLKSPPIRFVQPGVETSTAQWGLGARLVARPPPCAL